MLKYILLATSMLVAVPAMAQETKPADSTGTQQQTTAQDPAPAEDKATQAAPAESNPAPQTQAAQPTPTEPAEGQTAAQPAAPAEQPAQTAEQPAPAPTAQAPAQTAQQPAQPEPGRAATTPAEVAQVVAKEFAGYDKDSNGSLDKTEFAAWLNALRKASQPAFDPASPQATAWMDQAFAQADADKNSTVNQGELATFLTPKAS